MTTARTIITKALQKIGVLYKTEQPSSDEADDALFSLNAMLASWSNRSLLILARVVETFNLQGGIAAYTMGPGGDFDTARPIQIITGYTSDGSINYPWETISDEEFANITFPGISIPYPEFVNFTNNFPLSTLNFYPVPAQAFPVTIYSEKEISQLSSLDTVLEFAPGWDQAMIYNLAILLGPEYGQQVDAALVQIAKDSLTSIKTAIGKNRDYNFPYDLNDTQNIFAGWYYWG